MYIALLSNTTVSFADTKFARHQNFAQNGSFLTGHTNTPWNFITIKKILLREILQ